MCERERKFLGLLETERERERERKCLWVLTKSVLTMRDTCVYGEQRVTR